MYTFPLRLILDRKLFTPFPKDISSLQWWYHFMNMVFHWEHNFMDLYSTIYIPRFGAPVKNISRYRDQKLFSSYSYLNIKPSGGNYISIHYREPVKTWYKKAWWKWARGNNRKFMRRRCVYSDLSHWIFIEMKNQDTPFNSQYYAKKTRKENYHKQLINWI
jgi:hypothetical protein